MKPIAIIGAVATLAVACFGQTNSMPALYVHFGVETTTLPKRLLSARIHLGEGIFVSGEDYWKLTGHIDKRGTNIVADLLGDTGSQSQFYRGTVMLEEPFYGQGGAASGGVTPIWFVVSTNADSKPILERVKETIRRRLERVR
jgi:hypothetical protein